jgi:hypothetical protein
MHSYFSLLMFSVANTSDLLGTLYYPFPRPSYSATQARDSVGGGPEIYCLPILLFLRPRAASETMDGCHQNGQHREKRQKIWKHSFQTLSNDHSEEKED